jgi:hypothetical protein
MAKDELPLPGDEKKKPAISMNRLALWIIVGAIGAYLLLSGVWGLIAQG